MLRDYESTSEESARIMAEQEVIYGGEDEHLEMSYEDRFGPGKEEEYDEFGGYSSNREFLDDQD